MIDKTAVIHPTAQIADDAIIGPYVVIGENVNNRRACTAWIIKYGNMDYLECNDLEWDIKTKCSD